MKKLLHQKELKEQEFEKFLNKKTQNPSLIKGIKPEEIDSEDDSEEESDIKTEKSKNEPILTFNQIDDNYTRDELQDILEIHGLTKSGNKDELICRYRKFMLCKKWNDKKLKELSFTQMLDQFSKDDLQLILENKNLPISGNKEELIARVRVSLKNIKKKSEGKKEKKKKQKFSISNFKLKKLFEKKKITDLTVEELLEINRERGLNLPRNKSELLTILKIYLKNN